MHREDEWRPNIHDIGRATLRSGGVMHLKELNIVGLSVERDAQGRVVKIYSSNRSPFSVSSSADVVKWLSEPDDALLFTCDVSFLDSLLKWLGPDFMAYFEDEAAWGRRIRLEPITLTDRGGDTFKVMRGTKNIKKVYSLRPMYHMYKKYSGDEDHITVEQDARRLVQALIKYNIPVTNLYSAGGILQAWADYVTPQNLLSLPPELLEYADNCYHTNWITSFKLGTFKETYDYDIAEAYPSRAAELVSCHPTFGKWMKSEAFIPQASYGFCRVAIELWGSSPILRRFNVDYDPKYGARHSSIDCVGTWEGWMTKDEIEFIWAFNLGNVAILDGWWFIAKKEVLPFEGMVRELSVARAEAKRSGDKFLTNLFKIASVALQGKFKSTYNAYGTRCSGYLYNPIYAAAITARTRLKLAEFCLKHWDSLILTAVDGCVLSKKVEYENKPGELRLSSAENGEPCVVADDGEYWMPSRVSIFTPELLQVFENETFYKIPRTMQRNNRYAPSFDLIGLRPNRMDIVNLSRRRRRTFVDKPKVCKDLLDKTFEISAPLCFGKGG